MPNEPDPYRPILRRITIAMVVIGVAGAFAGALLRGWRFGAGFLLGAGISYVSFERWQKVVESLGGDGKGRSITYMVIRFLVLVTVAYAIVKYLEVNPVAVFLGLLVAAAAVLVSIVFEIIYART